MMGRMLVGWRLFFRRRRRLFAVVSPPFLVEVVSLLESGGPLATFLLLCKI
jgi:hypothetical protein